MTQQDAILAELERHRIVPVVVIDRHDRASALGEALVAGGLPVAEITFRTPAAVESVHALADRGTCWSELAGTAQDFSHLPVEGFRTMIAEVASVYPNFQVIATTLRTVRSATRNDWGAIGWSAATGMVQATQRDDLEILDRVGGGDSFAAGLIYGLLEGAELQTALDYGAAH